MTRSGGKNRGLFQRKGAWWIRYFDEHGQEHRECIGPKKLAEDAYRLRKTQVREHRLFPERIPDITMSAMIDDMLKRKRDKKSIKDITRFAENWRKVLGSTMLRAVKRGEIERYLAARGATRTRSTVYHEASFMRSLLKAALEDGRIDRSPMPKVKQPHAARREYLDDDAEKALFGKLPDQEAQDLVLFAIHTGLRQSEQFGLKWPQVDLRAKVMNIPQGKGKPRTVDLNDTALEILRRRPRRLHCEWVWPKERDQGHRNAHNFYSRTFRPAAKAAGLEWLTWHHLRHTFASRLAMSGADLRTVQELLGHSTLAMVQRYSHLSATHRAEAVRRLNGHKGGSSTGTGTGTDSGGGV